MMNQQLQNLSTQQLDMDNKFQYTDEELISRFQNGDEQAYIALVNRYKDKLINFYDIDDLDSINIYKILENITK